MLTYIDVASQLITALAGQATDAIILLTPGTPEYAEYSTVN